MLRYPSFDTLSHDTENAHHLTTQPETVSEGVELNFDKSRFDCIYMYVRRGGFRTLLSIILWENNYVF
jgi:hypothetical protein